MTKPIPSYLRLYSDTKSQAAKAVDEDLAAIENLCRGFSEATGWRLECGPTDETAAATTEDERALANLMWTAPVNPGVGASPGHIRLFQALERSGGERLNLSQAKQLAEGIGKLWDELRLARVALREREAELATAVPVVLEAGEAHELSTRLEAVLRGGAEAIGCQAAALYLLDSATSELKLRSSWNLSERRFIAPARPLRGAMADLEALLGHAVVLSDRSLFGYWKVPEPAFEACICVPVSSANMPLGTLWIYASEARDFSDSQTNIIEVVAGRVAAELERQVLADEARRGRIAGDSLPALELHHAARVPNIAPEVAGWQVAARVRQCDAMGSTFCDWFTREDGALQVVAGAASAAGLDGALTIASWQGAARATAQQSQAPGQLVQTGNAILWANWAGTEGGGLFQAVLAPGKQSCIWAAGGPLRVLRVGRKKTTAALFSTEPLGQHEALEVVDQTTRLSAGEVFVVYALGGGDGGDDPAWAATEAQLGDSLRTSLDLPAESLADIGSQILDTQASDYVLVIVKHRHA